MSDHIARAQPADRRIAEIGDELAVARALSNLANQLFVATASDIEAITQEPGTLARQHDVANACRYGGVPSRRP